ncbi:AmmeMemoRadiSam system radical SAM enzyme [Alkalitalea saponilacus]|uniref:Pyruvate formate lyase activating enzyme n=1 Tax=Alkalitalea saponilacus TaxID=889453 RepID=A0A1T5HQP5_9BACT|nr:AmmeMemoRadiSam system radical SAM enzyme [Alkalitalea saponilacus]ASB48421.1 AmmeMemoRadiSam system radical SAM enzyme [Alkalitalea saponilacus]SKC22999.1 pyruvate formate lyase activating enzyme [Alkalitalea saponilacus]
MNEKYIGLMTQFHTALYWKPGSEGVNCYLCPHYCQLKEGETGLCRTRLNYKNRLVTLAWNNPCAINIDPIEKKPLFHFLPGHRTLSIATNGCNLRCLNCQNHHISQCAPDTNTVKTVTSSDVVDFALRHSLKSISYTYTEPVVYYEYMRDVAEKAADNGLRNVMVSSVYINPKPLKDLLPLIDAINVDLKAFDEDVYQKLSGVSLKSVLKSLEIILKSNTWLEITCLVIPGFSDNPEHIEKMCRWLKSNGFDKTPIHFSKFFPAHELSHLPPTPNRSMLNITNISDTCGLEYVYIGNLPGNKFENTYCHNCGNMVMERSGNTLLSNSLISGLCQNCNHYIPVIQ